MRGTPKADPAEAGKAGNPPPVMPTPRSDPPVTVGVGAEAQAVAGDEIEPRRKRGSGEKRGNSNGMRHGLKAGKLPADAKHIEIQINLFRREIEGSVLRAKGEITLMDAASIQTACKWERHGALALRWLRKEGNNLKPTERLAFSREIARASTERDRALALLKLDRDVIKDAWSVIDAPAGAATDLEDK